MNSNKQIEILNKGSNKNRLTVTPSRITIKLQKNMSADEEADIIKKFLAISEKTEMKNCVVSFRGSYVLNKCPIISMSNDSGFVSYAYPLEEAQ